MRSNNEYLRSELSPFDRRPMGWSQLMAWVFPNSYELAMANIGYQWLFGLLRETQHLLVERVFADRGARPESLESGRGLGEFPIIALSLPFELDILNFLGLLVKAGIPLSAKDRPNGPLIIAGGDAITLNPFPFAKFFDAMILGCGEAWARECPEVLREFPMGLAEKGRVLEEIAKIPGAWIPEFDNGAQIQRSPDIRKGPAFTPILSSFGHFRNMFLVELERGCPFRCGFCSSNWLDRPVHYYTADEILSVYRSHGQNAARIGLVGSAVAESPYLSEIIDGFDALGARISPSSIRFDRIDEGILAKLANAGVRALTFAPETASEVLGRRVGKWIPPDEIAKYTLRAESMGFHELKLYWIIGLPGETDADVLSIAEAVKKIASASTISLSGSVNPFTPKPHTAFEREAMVSDNELKRKFALLKSALGKTRAKMEFNYSRQSRIAALLSIGGADLSETLSEIAHGIGIKTAFSNAGIDLDAPIFAAQNPPWKRIE